jgi:Arc/MetJ-type ribon-helix-helix transcriptional regulator
MNLALSSDAQKRIRAQVKSGKYATPEDVVTAALEMLDQVSKADDFADGELDALLKERESSDSLDGETVFAEIRKLGETYRQGKKR